MLRDLQLQPADGDEGLEALMQADFACEIEAQRDQLPDLTFLLLMARIDARNRRQAKVAAIESWSEILVLWTIATLAAFWWNDAATSLDALFPLAGAGVSWTTGLGLAAGLLTVLLFWSKTLTPLR